MKETNEKLGRRIRTANRLLFVTENGKKEVLLCKDRLGLNVFLIDVNSFSFTDIMNCLSRGELFERKQ